MSDQDNSGRRPSDPSGSEQSGSEQSGSEQSGSEESGSDQSGSNQHPDALWLDYLEGDLSESGMEALLRMLKAMCQRAAPPAARTLERRARPISRARATIKAALRLTCFSKDGSNHA